MTLLRCGADDSRIFGSDVIMGCSHLYGLTPLGLASQLLIFANHIPTSSNKSDSERATYSNLHHAHDSDYITQSCRVNRASHTLPFLPPPTRAAPTHRAIHTLSLQSPTHPVQPFIEPLKWLGNLRGRRLLDCRSLGRSKWKAWMVADVSRM